MRFHAELNALFMQAGFPGDPPEGNKTQKCLSWLRRANSECADPLSLFGTLIAEVMPSPRLGVWSSIQKSSSMQTKRRTTLPRPPISGKIVAWRSSRPETWF
jgi:hypothetical protein